jgi:type IV pilus assembly protein PilY1
VFGDVIDSSPIYVPELQALFVGSNDGMLHGFNAVTGAEYFAYVPGGVDLTALKTLSDPDYTHSYLVDGPIAVSTTTQTPGHNYLVGTLGRGGKGVYGLDVKAPATFGNADVLWERTTGTNMGQVLGEPLIVTLNNSSTKAVIIGNGINSSSGNAVLMILNLATGAVIKEIDTGVGSDNALFAPRGWDNDGNGTVDFVYGGDLKGNLWKFDLSGNTVTSWVVANSGSPMYVARDASNNRQPITAGLSLAREPISGTRWVFFGTGRFLSTADVSDMSVQSMYGIIDSDATVTGRTSAGDGNIQKRQFFVAGTVGGKLVRGVEAAAVLPTGKEGWYLDMVAPPTPTAEGERIISNPRVFGTVLLTASLIPPLDNTCDAGGRGYINAINAFTGASLDEPFFNVNGSSSGGHPNFADDTITGGTTTVPISSVDLGIGMPTKPTMIDSLLVVGGSQDLGDIQGNPQGVGSRRISWREIRKD